MSSFPTSTGIISETTFNIYEWFEDIFMPLYRLDPAIISLSTASRAGSPYFKANYMSKIVEDLGKQMQQATTSKLRFPLVALILNEAGTERKMYPEAGTFFEANINIWLIGIGYLDTKI